MLNGQILLFPDQRTALNDKKLYFLSVMYSQSSVGVRSDIEHCFRGVLLTPSDGGIANEFFRVGCGYVLGEEMLQVISHPEMSCQEGLGTVLHCKGKQHLYII